MRQYGTMGSMGRAAVSRERPRSLPRTAVLAAAVVLGCSLATLVAVAGVWGGSGGGGEVELVSWEAGRGSDPALEDGLQEMNETKHILKDPRAGTKNGWSNNFVGMKTPIKNWNPLGEDMVRSGIDDVFISRRDPAANETRPATQEECKALGDKDVCDSTHGCYYDFLRGCVHDDLAKPLMEDPTEEKYHNNPLLSGKAFPTMFPEWDKDVDCEAEPGRPCDQAYHNPVSPIHTYTTKMSRKQLEIEEDDGRDKSGFMKDRRDQVPIQPWFETIRVCNEEDDDDEEEEGEEEEPQVDGPGFDQGPGNECVGYDPAKTTRRSTCKGSTLKEKCRYDTNCGCIPKACLCSDVECVFGVISNEAEEGSEEGGGGDSGNATNATDAPFEWHGCINVKVPHLSARSQIHRGDNLLDCNPDSLHYDPVNCPGWVFGRGMHPDRDVSRHTIGHLSGHYFKEAPDGRYYMVDVWGNAIVPTQSSLDTPRDFNLFGKAVGCPGCHECIVDGKMAACLPSGAPKPTYTVRYDGPWDWQVDKMGEMHWKPNPKGEKRHHTRATWGFGHDRSKGLDIHRKEESNEVGSWFGLGGDRLVPREETIRKIGRMENMPDYMTSGGYSGWYKVVPGERFSVPEDWMANETNSSSIWSNFTGGYFDGNWIGPWNSTEPPEPPVAMVTQQPVRLGAAVGAGQANLKAGTSGEMSVQTLRSRSPRESARAAAVAERGRETQGKRVAKGVKFYYLPPGETAGGDKDVKGWQDKRPVSLWKMLGLEGKQVLTKGGREQQLTEVGALGVGVEGRHKQEGVREGASDSGGFFKRADGAIFAYD